MSEGSRVEKFTPGPWAAEIVWGDDQTASTPRAEWTGVHIGPEDDEAPGRVHGTFIEGHFVNEPAEANANLIAAAPELYESLLTASSWLRTLSGPDDPIITEVLAAASAALAKARGEAVA